MVRLPMPVGRFDLVIECRNFALSVAAGNANVWKPSPSTPLCSIAVTKIIASVLEKNGLPGAVSTLITGGKDVGEAIVESRDIPLGEPLFSSGAGRLLNKNILVSFTGSEAVGRVVGKTVQSRFGKSILELGGNNGTSLTSKDLEGGL